MNKNFIKVEKETGKKLDKTLTVEELSNVGVDDSKKRCKNCHTLFEGNYCSNCGQKGDEKRIKLSNLVSTFLNGFYHLHGGVLFTAKELFLQPGQMLRGYISGKRVDYLNPFKYLVLISLVGGLVYKMSGMPNHIDEIMLASEETIKFTVKHFSYRILFTIPTYALMGSIIYKSFKYNFAEHLVINTFLMSQSMIIMVIWMLVSNLLKPDDMFFEILYYCGFISFIIYQTIVFFQLFNIRNTLVRSIKAFIVVITGLGLGFMLMDFIVKFSSFF